MLRTPRSCAANWRERHIMNKRKSPTRAHRHTTYTYAALRKSPSAAFARLAAELAEIGRGFYARGWVLGTSGNFSAVLSREPLRFAITSTGVDKGSLGAAHILEMDDATAVVRGNGRPSAEALLHVAIVRGLGAGAVLHN